MRGKPLYRHAADVLATIGFARQLIVCADDAVETPLDFERVAITSGQPQSASIKAGIAALDGADVDAVLIVLADMPLVPARHFAQLVARFDALDGKPLASGDGTRAMPPVIFGRSQWPALRAISGDQGARHLLRDAQRVEAPAGELVDIDRPEELDRIR